MSLGEGGDQQPVERIDALEQRIDELGEAIARSRRLMAGGRVAAVVGPLFLLALMLGVFAYSPARVLLALALLIGGVVLTGSSKSSTDQLQRSRERLERERDAEIDALGLAPLNLPPPRGRRLN